jgi:hypothetical protein
MIETQPTPVPLRERACDAILRELGPVGFARFVQQTEACNGDYTRDRGKWLNGISIDQIVDMARRRRATVRRRGERLWQRKLDELLVRGSRR